MPTNNFHTGDRVFVRPDPDDAKSFSGRGKVSGGYGADGEATAEGAAYYTVMPTRGNKSVPIQVIAARVMPV